MVWAVAEDAAAATSRGVESFMVSLDAAGACQVLVWMLVSRFEQVTNNLYTVRPPVVIDTRLRTEAVRPTKHSIAITRHHP